MCLEDKIKDFECTTNAVQDKIELYEKIRKILKVKMETSKERTDYYKYENRYNHINNEIQRLYRERREKERYEGRT